MLRVAASLRGSPCVCRLKQAAFCQDLREALFDQNGFPLFFLAVFANLADARCPPVTESRDNSTVPEYTRRFLHAHGESTPWPRPRRGLSHSKDGVSSAANVAAAQPLHVAPRQRPVERLDVLLEVLGEDDLVTTAALSCTRYLRATCAVLLLWALAIFVVSGPDMSEEPWPPDPIGE